MESYLLYVIIFINIELLSDALWLPLWWARRGLTIIKRKEMNVIFLSVASKMRYIVDNYCRNVFSVSRWFKHLKITL